MKKLEQRTPDFSDEHIAKIAEMFPHCVAEAEDENGKLTKAIDFDLLKQELSRNIIDGPRERYRLDWPGKRASLVAANTPITKTLRPVRKESIDFYTTKNLYIEGDNLDALKLLQKSYLGAVKMIYIDPPYNTGKDFVYKDNFARSREEELKESGQIDEKGGRLVANLESNGRFHSDWLSMMYPRLRLARNLLRDDGVIFISIDDNEVHNLRKICDEVFGEDNFVAQIAVQLNPRGRHLDKFIAKTYEYILIYTKNILHPLSMFGIEKEGEMLEEYNLQDEYGHYRILGLRNRNQSFNPTTRPNLYYPLYVNPANGQVSLEKTKDYTDEVFPITSDGIKTCWTWGREKVEKDNNLLIAKKTGSEWRIYRKDYLEKNGEIAKTLPKSLWLEKEINNDYGKKAIKSLFGKNIMDFPKSPFLISKIVKISTKGSNDIILDFFSGSATTAHAVMQLNAEDGGNRKFIMVQLPEPTDEKSEAYKAGYKTIAEIGKERIRRAGRKIKEENADKEGIKNLDIGFRVLKIDSSNMKDVYFTPDETDRESLFDTVDHIKEGRRCIDLLFGVLVDWGVDLTLSIRREKIMGKTVFFVGDDALAACFDDNLDEAFLKELAGRDVLRVVFKESGFKDDAAKINAEQIFAQLAPGTDVRVI
jgi:adenine-specific DNA-methyltransferase